MARFFLDKKLLWGFRITTIFLLVLIGYSYFTIQKFIEAKQWQDHTRLVVSTSELILTACMGWETGQRGYVITNDEIFLEPYTQANAVMDSLLAQLDTLINDNERQQIRVEQLKATINKKKLWVDSIISLATTDAALAQRLVKKAEGKRLMDSIKDCISTIQKEEAQLYDQRNDLSQASLFQYQVSAIGTLLVSLGLVAALFYLINRTLKARYHSELQLQTAAAEIQDLYDHAPCGYLSVDSTITLSNINQTLLNWLGYQVHEVVGKFKYPDLLTEKSRKQFEATFEKDFEDYRTKGFVNGLEFDFLKKDGTALPVLVNSVAIFDAAGNFAKSRTSVFDNTQRKEAEERAEVLRKEMEAFTYSVSHDLRAPLRFIDGYAQMLEDDYKDKLDVEGRRLLATIQKNARRMGNLIDDLLDFSRMGRKELMLGTVHMIEVVKEVLDELQITTGSSMELQVQPLGVARADMNMIKQVWSNLISNAVKYSRKQPISQIEIGRIELQDEDQFYVKDNGVGFDMNYAHKLFEVFQRLHKVQEFEGTGVGLAVVKRIVARHGGRVWATARPNGGAIFYFSLPK
ncbi:MAG: CHASE3 domain-containing protein [Cytophagales bacterium]|nr:CHASE3 domain-containing protein [Cytophagales bacterium]